MAKDIRSFLRRTPKPHKVRVENADGVERFIPTDNARTRWHSVEESVRNARAVLVECIDKEGQVLRSMRLDEGEEEEDGASGYAQQRKGEEALIAKDRGQMAAMFDAYGKRIAAAYEAGAAAASQSQDKLVILVETLTENLTAAIVNLHNIAVSHAEQLQVHARQVAMLTQGEGEGGTSSAALMQLAAAAMGVRPPAAPGGVDVNVNVNGKGKGSK
jgi:hypothetical protein